MTGRRLVRREPVSSWWRSAASLPPFLAKIYAARDVTGVEELEHTVQRLLPFSALKGMTAATTCLADAVQAGRRILIVADFDADGATSCAVAVRGLRSLGAADVRYVVPNRFEYGYGLTPEIVAVAAEQQPEVLVTVDNGIASVAGVRAARELGMQVVVTDHHLPGAELPPADAIVNPNQAGDNFPSKHLAGVGVMFYVLLALRAELRRRQWFGPQRAEPNLAQWLDLVALGTVADVVPLDHNNRILVEQGLRRMRSGALCPGITALLQAGGRSYETVVAADLSFCVGPRLNAAGRLEDMSLGIECLLTDDPARAQALAARLDQLNQARKEIEADMRAQALAAIERMSLAAETELPTGLCLYDASWHQGVIGILASRIKDRLHRPVIAFAPADGDELKGSARSIPGVHIRDVLDAVATGHPGLVSKFGGHAMAAGVTLRRGDLAAFQEAFAAEVRQRVQPGDLSGCIYTDGELAAEDISLATAELLRKAGPWGQGFPEPVFDGVFTVVQERIVGEQHLKLAVQPVTSGPTVDAIAFRALEHNWPQQQPRLHLAYRLDVNVYQGRRSVQLIVEHMEPA